MKNCKLLGNTSLALEVNHTLNDFQHQDNLIKIKRNIKKIFK